MNSKELQKIFQSVVKNLRCPHCGDRYAFDKIHIVSIADRICFLSLECKNHMPIMASVAITGNILEEPGQQISADERIDLNKKLSSANSISELFK